MLIMSKMEVHRASSKVLSQFFLVFLVFWTVSSLKTYRFSEGVDIKTSSKPTNEIFSNSDHIYSFLEPFFNVKEHSLLLLGKNVRGFLLRNRSFAKGADSSEWLRVNVV
jgi:hypothetical protein